MSYINQIVEDGVTYDIQAKALDSTLDATILKKSNLVNGFTQTTPGVNALDAAAGKSLNDSLANKAYRGQLSETIDDNTLESGLYTLRGASATGTFPNNDAKYSVLVVVNRSNTSFQMLYTATEVYTRSISSTSLTAEWTSHIHTLTTTEVTQTANIAAGFASITCTQPSGTHKAKILISAYVRTSNDIVMQGILPSTGTARFYNGGSAYNNATVVSTWLLVD